MNNSLLSFSMEISNKVRFVISLLLLSILVGQHRGDEIGFQGVELLYNHSYKSGFSGMPNSIASNSLSEIFRNPASLASLKKFKISSQNGSFEKLWRERQDYRPNRQLVTMSFILDGLYTPDINYDGWYDHEAFLDDTTYLVNDPELGLDVFSEKAADWQREDSWKNKNSLLIGLPFKLLGKPFVVSAYLGNNSFIFDYDRNQTNLTPHPAWDGYNDLPDRVTGAEDSVRITWSNYERSRSGPLQSYVVSFSYGITDRLSLGLSYNKIIGDSEDIQKMKTIGHFDLIDGYNTYKFRYDSLLVEKKGRSQFDLSYYNLGIIINHESIQFGVNFLLPHSINREWNYGLTTKSTDSTTVDEIKGNEMMEISYVTTYSIYFRPHEKFAFSSAITKIPFSDAEFDYSRDSLAYTNWVDQNQFSFGMSYWLFPKTIINAGIKIDSKPFIPDGNAFQDTGPLTKSIVFGIEKQLFFGTLNVAYEMNSLKYYDVYFSNTNWAYEGSRRIYFDFTVFF